MSSSTIINGPLQNRDLPERLSGSIERVIFHSEATGFCVLRVKVKGHRDLVTVVSSAASMTAGWSSTNSTSSTRSAWPTPPAFTKARAPNIRSW
uniref:YrrC family ATP-dependent DNA helicase n=1 Tax=Methylomicrobium lacus TaxID=136992 RepID=UPI00403E6A35